MRKKEKVSQFHRYYLYNFIFLIISLFLIFGFWNSRVLTNEAHVNFKEHTALISTLISNPTYPDGLSINLEQMDILNASIDKISEFTLSEINSYGEGALQIYAASNNFVDTGVIENSIYTYNNVVEDIELIYGRIWDEDSNDQVIVLDQASAMNLFDKENAVGEFVETDEGNFEVIGIVTNTSYREQQISRDMQNGHFNFSQTYSTNAYIPLGFIEENQIQGFDDSRFVFFDQTLTDREIEDKVSEILAVDTSLINTKSDVLRFMNSGANNIAILCVIGVIILSVIAHFIRRAQKHNLSEYLRLQSIEETKKKNTDQKDIMKSAFKKNVLWSLKFSSIGVAIGLFIVVIGPIIVFMSPNAERENISINIGPTLLFGLCLILCATLYIGLRQVLMIRKRLK